MLPPVRLFARCSCNLALQRDMSSCTSACWTSLTRGWITSSPSNMYLPGFEDVQLWPFLDTSSTTAIMSAQNWSSQPALHGHMIRIGLHAPILPIILFFPRLPIPNCGRRTRSAARDGRQYHRSQPKNEARFVFALWTMDGRRQWQWRQCGICHQSHSAEGREEWSARRDRR